nr:hypothetical protein [Tanacetum cinerariifolium]
MVSEPKMVNTRTDAELSAAIQNALQTLLPQIRAEIREEFHTSSGPSDSGENPPPVTIHTWLERFNKQKPRSFEKATAPAGFLGEAAGTEEEQAKKFQWGLRRSTLNYLMCISYTDERLKREYHSIRQTDTETSTEFMQRFLRLVGFLGAAAGTAEEQAKNFQWGLRRQKSGDRHQPTTQQSSHRNHGHKIDHHGSDRRGGGFQQSRGPSKGYSYPVCTTCRRRHPGEYRRAIGTCFKCGQTGHLQKDCKKNTAVSTSGQADKKPGASGRIFAITEDHATKTSGTINGTLFIYGHAVFVLFDTGATHSVISSVFASSVTTTPTLLDHVLCISTPMKNSVRITHVYRDLSLQFDDKIRAINALPLDMCEFDIILGISRYYTLDEDAYPEFLGDNDEGMDFLAFIRTADSTKVRVAERQRAENEPRLLESTVGRLVPLLPIAPARAFGELEASVDKLFDEGACKTRMKIPLNLNFNKY